MKSVKQSLVALAAFACLLPMTASAHHQGDAVGEAIEQAQYLDQVVQQSWLRPNVKWTVRAYTNAVSQLASCADDYAQSPASPLSLSPIAHHLGGCDAQISQAEAAWSRVAYYLYDATDMPQVYQQYQAAGNAFQVAVQALQQ